MIKGYSQIWLNVLGQLIQVNLSVEKFENEDYEVWTRVGVLNPDGGYLMHEIIGNY